MMAPAQTGGPNNSAVTSADADAYVLPAQKSERDHDNAAFVWETAKSTSKLQHCHDAAVIIDFRVSLSTPSSLRDLAEVPIIASREALVIAVAARSSPRSPGSSTTCRT